MHFAEIRFKLVRECILVLKRLGIDKVSLLCASAHSGIDADEAADQSGSKVSSPSYLRREQNLRF